MFLIEVQEALIYVLDDGALGKYQQCAAAGTRGLTLETPSRSAERSGVNESRIISL
jgi:hypothetical protein